MGIKRMGPPEDLVIKLRDFLTADRLIETGTYMGDTAIWASERFNKVVTIEYSEEIYQNTSRKYSHMKNIEFLYGHTLARLGEIVPQLQAPAIFWLDAHWSGGTTYGRADECPILAEIEIINRTDLPHALLIDDARLFTAPPPPPHNTKYWPDISALLATINSKQGRYSVIVDDILISVPESARPLIEEYCAISQGSPTPRAQIRAGYKMIMDGMRSLFTP
jgi:hypothetical protein